MYKWHISVAAETVNMRLFRNIAGQRSYKPEWVHNSGNNTGKARNLAAQMLPTVARRDITRLIDSLSGILGYFASIMASL